MSRRLPGSALPVVLLLLSAAAWAQTDPVVDSAALPEPGASVAPVVPATAAPVARSPLMQEITAAWTAHEVVVAALEKQLEASTDASAALALQRQIETARAQVEIEILRIQARHARQAGRLDIAAELETTIGQLTTPPARGEPVRRVREAN